MNSASSMLVGTTKRILLVHSSYRQSGGEDAVFEAETQLLSQRGCDTRVYRRSNDSLLNSPLPMLAAKAIWNGGEARSLREAMREFRPDIVHVHNTFPLLSPAVLHVAKSEGAATVQTLHNFRPMCPAGTFHRDGRVCEDCKGMSVPWPAVVHGCYRGSRSASAAAAAMLTSHRLLGTYGGAVDLFVAPTEFVRRKYVEGGFDGDKIVVKPHFVISDPGESTGDGGYALFVGRLTEEKGVRTLMDAWAGLADELPLRIVGDGPLRDYVESIAKSSRGISVLGARDSDDVAEQMRRASLLVFPSEWFESFGLVIIEAFAASLPVVASDMGAARELVADGESGVLFRAGDPTSLRSTIQRLVSDPPRLARMRRAARDAYLKKYTADVNFGALMAIYNRVLGRD